MTVKRHIFLLVCLIGASTVIGQPRLVFSPDDWDFGSVREAEGPVSHTFTGENQGDEPAVILDVVTSCGCTVPVFSRKPILPGEKTRITVTFDPANRPGTFSKELGVYSTERRKLASLTVRGEVEPRPRSFEERYPVDAGGGLRLSSTLCAFSFVRQGVRVQSAIGCANVSDRPIGLRLVPEAGSGVLDIEYPRQIAPGQTGSINLSYLIPADAPRYGTLRDVLRIETDGRSGRERLVVHGIGIDAPTEADRQHPAMLRPSESIVRFGPVKRSGGTRSRPLTLTNAGSGELIVRAVETGDKITTALRPGTRIPAGASVETTVTVDPSRLDFGAASDFLTLITNDISRPMRKVRVTAIVEE